jgi:RNA polymerase sigma-70 factor (ECF subfamily)
MSDNDIISQIRSGGQKELGILYENYRSEFLHWISKEFKCSDDDSKDIYQLTILIFYENVKSGKLQHLVSSVKTYLFGIGKNVAKENIRKTKRNLPIDQQKWLKEYLIDDPEQVVEQDIFEIAKNALAQLGGPCQQLLELFYYEKKSMDEITTMLHYRNSDSTKNQKYKCMSRLRHLFEQQSKSTTIVSHS